jgi:hypothetical protein
VSLIAILIAGCGKSSVLPSSKLLPAITSPDDIEPKNEAEAYNTPFGVKVRRIAGDIIVIIGVVYLCYCIYCLVQSERVLKQVLCTTQQAVCTARQAVCEAERQRCKMEEQKRHAGHQVNHPGYHIGSS